MYLIGDVSEEERRHAEECAECQTKIAGLVSSLSNFRGAVRNWSDRAGEQRLTVIAGADHLDRMLLPATPPWYRSLWNGVCELAQPAPPPLDITSKPMLVRDIWGQYGRQKKSWVMSLALQAAVVAVVVGAAVTPPVREKIQKSVQIFIPDPSEYQANRPVGKGGGSGGDRSLLEATRGKLPKLALKQFTPPAAVVANLNPKLSMDPTLIGSPDLQLPDVNMDRFGDPLKRLGPPSNGPGCCGGIGSGHGTGVGDGKGVGYGPGMEGGVGGNVYSLGGGVTAPSLLTKVEPEYSEEARKARHQGVVLLYVEVDPDGRAQNIRVVHSLGLGLDEKAIAAVKQWRFVPGKKDGRAVTVAATIEVYFRLL